MQRAPPGWKQPPISLFCDELTPEPSRQIEVLVDLELEHVDLRSAWNVDILALDQERLGRLAILFVGAGIRVACLATRIGKRMRVDETERLETALARAFAMAELFEVRLIRIFGFLAPAGEGVEPATVREVTDRLGAFAACADRRGVTLLLETERGLNRGAPLAHAPDSDAGTEERDDGFKSASFTGGYHHLVESRWPERPGMAPGSIVWVHVQFPIVEGEQPTPFQRVAAVSDFGNALANHAADWDDPGQRMRASYINTDISVHLLRPPAGEWLCLVADRSTHINGVGLVEGARRGGRWGGVGASFIRDAGGDGLALVLNEVALQRERAAPRRDGGAKAVVGGGREAAGHAEAPREVVGDLREGEAVAEHTRSEDVGGEVEVA